MSKRKQSIFEDLVELTAKVPWWIGALLAIVSYLILHNLAAIKVTGSMKPGEFGNFVVKQMWVTIGFLWSDSSSRRFPHWRSYLSYQESETWNVNIQSSWESFRCQLK